MIGDGAECVNAPTALLLSLRAKLSAATPAIQYADESERRWQDHLCDDFAHATESQRIAIERPYGPERT